jgi:F1F0 ATPase subunit 2
MNEQLLTAGALFAGVLIGLLFFGGLWWTVRKSISSRNPGLLFAASFLLRTLSALPIFYFIGSGSWQRLLACLLGFILGRILVSRLSEVPRHAGHGPLKEGAH